MPNHTPKRGFFQSLWNPPESVEDRIALRRSHVRIAVTHGAAWFLFGGGGFLIAWMAIVGCDGIGADAGATANPGTALNGCQQGVDLFQMLAPIAASIVTFWFAGRTHEKQTPEPKRDEEQSSADPDNSRHDSPSDEV